LGIWAGLRDGEFFVRAIRVLARWGACYGVLWILFLNQLPWTVPGTDGRVLLFMDPQGGAMVALLGLLAFEPQLRKVWHLLLLNSFVLLGVQGRSEWLGLAIGALVFAFVMRKMRQLAEAATVLVLLLGIMFVTGLTLPSPTGRGEGAGASFSANSVLARIIAPFNENLAGDLAPVADVNFATSTTEWRLVWWANLWAEVHSKLSAELIGFGYGYPIGDLNPDIVPGTFIQTPHNAVLYALVFTGWLGVVLFVLLQAEVCRLLLRSFRITNQPFGLMCWAAFLAMALFGTFFEAPFGAIPFYLLMGAAAAPGVVAAPETSVHRICAPILGSLEIQGA
jgi:hypothetical protein